ncbi:MAG: glycosyltransferase family 4 protein [Anaerolineales bacterium]|nr:glycosyltransferase family 4 protein [Anaerolineales bacterium]
MASYIGAACHLLLATCYAHMIIGIDASRAATTQRTGTEAYAYFLIQALLPLAGKRGHTVRLYFNQPPAPGLFPPLPHVEQRIIPFPRLWTHLRLAWELHQHPPNVFFTPAHVIPFSYRRHSVATVHDLGYHHFPEAHTRRQVAYLRWSTHHNGRSAHTILADSQATKDDLIRFYHTPAAKIKVVYPGIDPALQRASEAEITAVCHKYAITPPYFLYLSTLQPRKNLIRLIKAFAATNLPHQLVLAGKPGWLSQPILQTIANLQSPISNRIPLPGFIPDSDKAALLSGATALLYPSLYEGFGFPLLEAQACETAVLSANTSSLPELAADSALLVDPLDTAAIRDGIIRLAEDATLRQTLVAKGQENARRFRWEKTAVSVLNLLEEAG